MRDLDVHEPMDPSVERSPVLGSFASFRNLLRGGCWKLSTTKAFYFFFLSSFFHNFGQALLYMNRVQTHCIMYVGSRS